MNWREALGTKLMTADAAVSVVESGHRVAVAPYISTPNTLCEALYKRRGELGHVRIDHTGGLFSWVRPEEDSPFEVYDNYGTPMNRDMVNQGRVEHLPVARWREDEVPPGFVAEPDVYLVAVSPPDRHGYCSFGPGVWLSRKLCLQAQTVIAEVHEDFIRTGGDNYIHISSIDRLCEAAGATGIPLPGPRTEEERAVTRAIGTLVAAELVRDRDTIQIGVGTVSAALGLYLGGKGDLGVQTELITAGIATLVDQGVITGKYKTLHQGKVVASACAALTPKEFAIIDGNPAFELYDFGYTDDIRMLVRHDNLVAINNALLVDLTGQVASETIGPRVWAGVGGQTVFMIAAQYSRGGRSITVLPSSHVINGRRVSRIVGALPEATVVTVPRTFVDYVVTEHGIATLRGKTVRERIGELLAIAHPDCRGTLKSEAKRLYGIAA